MSNSSLYDRDFYAWTAEQAALLREGRLSQADIANIAEEIESMGRSEKRELVSRLTVLLLHLLKWQFQPGLRAASWRASIQVQRISLETHLGDNPSLNAAVPDVMAQAYRISRIEAGKETGLAVEGFPAVVPWGFELVMDEGFWPDD